MEEQVCPICLGQGYKKIKDDHGFEEYTVCDCHKSVIDRRIFFNRLTEAGIPKHFWGYELSWYKDKFSKSAPSQDRKLLFDFIDEPTTFVLSDRCLWLWSEGEKIYKTSLAIQLGKKLIADHKIKFLSFRKLMDLFLDFEHKQAVIHSYLTADFIIIDDIFDLSRATAKEYQAINLYGFIEDAINANVKFICTSNKNISAFSADKFFSQTAGLLQVESNVIFLKGV